jgi:hypothetical protein
MDDNTIQPLSKENKLRFIHSKLVESPIHLFSFLKETFGPGKFEVEVRFRWFPATKLGH